MGIAPNPHPVHVSGSDAVGMPDHPGATHDAIDAGLPSFAGVAGELIEQQEIPQDLVRSMVTSFADQRIQVISQRVLTNANLSSIIEKYNLYAKDREDKPL